MGVWGIGLYSSDFARDLRGAVKAVTRLPFAPERLLEFLSAVEPSAANDPADPDHTIFWLVVAEQFARRGIDCARARETALAIIRGGTDLATMKALGMDDKSLASRREMLDEVQARITVPITTAKPCAVLKAPQKLLLQVGEVLTYPVCNGKPVNPYAGSDSPLLKKWRRDGWGVFVLAERGLEFEFLAWYRPVVICESMPEQPTLAHVLEPRMWLLRNPGTLSPRHAERMQLKSLGCVSIDAARLTRFFPKRVSPVSCVVSDISIANSIAVRSVGVHEAHRVKHGYPPAPRLHALTDIADTP